MPCAEKGSVQIFELIAQFLEQCHFTTAAHAIIAQCSEHVPPLEGVLQRFRSHVDNCALLLAELEAMKPKSETAREAFVHDLLDNLLRKLMATGQCLSDDKLLTCIDTTLKSEAFPKLDVMDIVLDPKQVDTGHILTISDVETSRFWESIQKEMQPQPEVSQPVPTADAQSQNPVEPAVSSHYIPKRRDTPQTSVWDVGDEYHDDEDPGYRIREIYEAELLAELSQKMASTNPSAPATEPTDADELTSAGIEQGQAAAGENPDSPEPSGNQSSATDDAAAEVSLGATPGGTENREQRSASPTFGGPVETETPAEEVPAEVPAATEGAQPTVEAQTKEALEAAHFRKDVQYAPSGDSFYPVELNGAIFDSFNLRVVFERDKTGFEESKEFPIRTNTVVAARYQIIEYLGSAAFSRAVQCLDLDTNKMVCMKIIKNDKDFFDQSLDEIKLLKYINVNGNVDHNHVLRLYDHFYHKEHLIIVTELLRDNLYEFSKYNRECGDEPYFTMGRLQKISKQILTALEYVHSLRLIHCDLKPENILIKSYSRCEVKVIDFGSSCFVDDHLSSYVQSRSYRAPEVMLGLPYDQKIDLWSLGCIIAELWTGYVLFQNDSVQSLLARILGIVGDFPYHLMTSGKYVPQYFTQDGQLYQEIEGQPCPERGRRLHLLVPKKTSLRQRMRTDDELFLDFLSQLLQLDPTKRPGAAEASQHPFLAPGRYQDGL